MTFQTTSFLYIVALWFPWVESQFPKACVNLKRLRDKTCCPTPNGFKAPCGADGYRGECRDLIVRRWDKAYSHYQEFIKGTTAMTGPMHFSKEVASASQILPATIVASVNTVTMVTNATRTDS